MSKPLTTRLTTPKGPFPALIPVGRHAGRPAISLRRPVTLVGSRENAHVHLSSQSVDPAHALIVLSGGRVYIRDLASHAGVQVNDLPVLEAELGRDDVLKVGTFQFRVSLPDGPAAAGQQDEETPAVRVMVDGQPVAMDGHVLLIGRRGACDVVLTDPMASRVHAAVVAVNGQYVVRDLGSRAGTLVNGDKVHEQVLESGDEIYVGSHEIFFKGGAPAAAAAGWGGGDLVDLEDSLAAAPQDAEAPVAASAELADEPADPLDLHLPDVAAEPGIGDLDAAVPLEGAAEPEPVAEAPAAASDEDEDSPIPLDLDLDLSVPEPAPEAADTPEVAEAEPVAASPAAEEVAAPVEPEEEPIEAAAPPAEPSVPEAADEAAIPVETAEATEPPVVADADEGIDLTVPAPVEGSDVEQPPVDEELAADVTVPIEAAEAPAVEQAAAEEVEPQVAAEVPDDVEAATPIAIEATAPAEDEPIAFAPEPPAAESPEIDVPVVENDRGDILPVAAAEEIAPIEAGTSEFPDVQEASANKAHPAAEDDDLFALVAEEIGSPAPADSLSGTPFGTALGEVVTEAASEASSPADVVDDAPASIETTTAEPLAVTAAEAEAAAEPVEGGDDDESQVAFGFGANQALCLAGSPVDWYDTASLGLTSAIPQFEVSLSGVHGTVEGVEQLDEPAAQDAAAPTDEPPLAPADNAAHVAEVPVSTEEGVAAAVAVDPPAVPEVRREQLLGFIRIDEVKPAAPLAPKGPIEPVRSVVEPSADAAPEEPPVDLPLETDDNAAAQPGRRAAAPAPSDSPDSLHAVKPPPAAYRITRGLSSLTGGGRAVDVFSQLPVVSEDPVLGKVSGPARIPPVDDPALAREPTAPPTEDELSRALQSPQAEFDAPEAATDRPGVARPLFIRKLKRLFRERGGTLSVAAAMAAAGAATYGLTPSTTIVRAEINYRNFSRLDAPHQRALEAHQHDLLTDPAVLADAVEAVSAGPSAPGPGFLASPVVMSTMLDRADANLWPADRPGTMALSLRSSEPDADAARLRALLAAVVNAQANKQLVASAGQSAEKAKAVRAELAELDRNVGQLERDRAAAEARLASADDRAAPAAATAMPEPSADERAWAEASLAALKAQAEVADLTDRKVPAGDPRLRQAESRLAAARAAEAAARDRFVASQHNAAGPVDGAATNDPQRRAAEAAVALRTLRSQREARAAELKRLEADATAAVYPELPKTDGVWTNRVPDHRNVYSIAAASVVGLCLSTYLGSRSKRFS